MNLILFLFPFALYEWWRFNPQLFSRAIRESEKLPIHALCYSSDSLSLRTEFQEFANTTNLPQNVLFTSINVTEYGFPCTE
jgi:hypothetical protein